MPRSTREAEAGRTLSCSGVGAGSGVEAQPTMSSETASAMHRMGVKYLPRSSR